MIFKLMDTLCVTNVSLFEDFFPASCKSLFCLNFTRNSFIYFCFHLRLLAVGLQQFYEYVENINQQSDSNTNTTHEALKLTIHYLLPNYTPSFLLHIIKKKENDDPDSSSIKV